MNILIWILFMVFPNLLYGSIVFKNLPQISLEKWNLFQFFFNLMIISTITQFIFVRICPGSNAEIISTIFISFGTGSLLFSYVHFMKELDRLNEQPQYR